MVFLKKDGRISKKSSEETKTEKDENLEIAKEKKIKTRKKIGFRPRREEPVQKDTPVQQEIDTEQKVDQLIYNEDSEKGAEDKEIDIDLLKDITSDQEKEELPKTKKKKPLIPRDMRDKPVYLEDTGEQLGTVFDLIYDKDRNHTGYKIKDSKSDAILSFSVDQFIEDKEGLIFAPSWYTKAVKTIEKFEFKDRISPELTTLLMDDAISHEEIYNIFVKHDDEMARYMEDAVALRGGLNKHLVVLERQRMALKESLMDLTEKRLIKDIDRRKFAEYVTEHRRKVNILDVNIKKCKESIKRLDHTSFGFLTKRDIASSRVEKEDEIDRIGDIDSYKGKDRIVLDDEIEDIYEQNLYKQKYYNLKGRFDQLEEDYNELKIAVEKLITRNE